jgi:hypothetical protein
MPKKDLTKQYEDFYPIDGTELKKGKKSVIKTPIADLPLSNSPQSFGMEKKSKPSQHRVRYFFW